MGPLDISYQSQIVVQQQQNLSPKILRLGMDPQ